MSTARPSSSVPSLDLAAMDEFLCMLIDPALGCAEIRVLEANIDYRTDNVVSHDTFKSTVAVWSNSVQQLLDQAKRICGISAYVTVNPVNLALRARADRLLKARSTTTDADVVGLRFLPLDFDVKRPNGISSTAAELAAARARLADFLAAHPDIEASSIWGCSGNGCWLLLRLPDYPNDDEHRALIARAIDWFSERYSDAVVEIDPACKNPSRVMPLVGTMKCKGVDLPDRPHRMVTLETPSGRLCVPLDLKAFMALNAPAAQPGSQHQNGAAAPAQGPDPAKGKPATGRTAKRMAAYGAKALKKIADQVASLASPGRYKEARRGTMRMASLVKSDLVSEADYRTAATEALKQCGMDPTKIPGLVDSALKKAQPRKKLPDFKADDRPEIVIRADEHLVVDEALDAIKTDPALFQRGNVLVMVTRASSAGKQKGVVERPDGSVQIATMPKAMLRRLMSMRAAWLTYKVDRKGNSALVPAHVPGWAVDQLWDLRRWPGVRHLEGIIEAPTMRPDGSLLVAPGYDDQTGLLYLPGGDFPPIPENPDRLEAMMAAADLLAVVNDFPFASEGHRHAYLAALITPLVRFAIEGPCPLFLLDANVAASGKTKLCDLIAILATGRKMPRSRYQFDDAEMDKTMLSIALAGDRLMLFDNVPGGFSIGGGSLDAALTGFTVKGRILGESRMSGDVPITTAFYATGNNLGLRGDALRRVVPIRLESTLDRPEERTDYRIKDLLGYVSAERPRLVAAALTIVRAYVVAGRPDQGLTPMDYPAWCRVVRDAVAWTTGQDPCKGRSELIASDEETNQRRALVQGFEVLCAALGKTHLTVAEMIKAVEDEPLKHPVLHSVFTEWARDRKLPTAKTIGMQLRQIRKRAIDGKCFDRTNNTIAEWYLRRVM
jgi:hypothetical protein